MARPTLVEQRKVYCRNCGRFLSIDDLVDDCNGNTVLCPHCHRKVKGATKLLCIIEGNV